MCAQQGQVKSNLVEVKSLSTHLTTEAAAIVESLGSPGHQQVTAGNSWAYKCADDFNYIMFQFLSVLSESFNFGKTIAILVICMTQTNLFDHLIIIVQV